MTFEIETAEGVWLDMLPYTFREGFSWSLSDIDASTAGRTMDGSMQRARVASKVRLDVSCPPLTTAQASVVLKAIYPAFVRVRYLDPMENDVVIKTMYSNNRPASYAVRKVDPKTGNATEYWTGISFPLIER